MYGGEVVSNEEICSSDSLRHFFLEYKYRGAVKRLANGITHSYNNIFTGLAGQLSMHLRDGDHSQQYKKRREQIDSLLQRGVQQTGLFFEFCRFKPEEYKINSPGRIAERAVDLLNSLSRLHHVEVFIDRGAPAIASKFNDLVLMLFYLGENAFEAMADGGLARLEVRAGKDHQGMPRVTFAVIDGGHGFPEELLPLKNFQPKFSSDGGQGLSGLGLFAVQAILADHCGELAIESSGAHGTVMLAHLPCRQETTVEKPAEKPLAAPGRKKAKAEDKYMLLVVDDEESMRNILLDQLHRRGHVAFSADCCAEAVKEFAELSDIITAVLLDIGLKGSSGYDCIAPLREIKPDITIILMSGENSDSHRLNEPHTHFLTKPFAIEMVERICRS
jgi:CheY-like chemotaxis protein